MALKVLTFLLISLFNLAFAGNGSSGVGTASIAKGYQANNFEGLIKSDESSVIDLESNEKIFAIEIIEKRKINFSNLNPSSIGKVKGFEFTSSNIKENNFWILCKDDMPTCTKLIPTSKTNKKIPSILGSLVETNE